MKYRLQVVFSRLLSGRSPGPSRLRASASLVVVHLGQVIHAEVFVDSDARPFLRASPKVPQESANGPLRAGFVWPEGVSCALPSAFGARSNAS